MTIRGAGLQECWRLDSRKKHVRTDSRFLARHELERLVGGQPALSRSNFILTHHAPAIEMEGGTTFYFVTGGIHEALDRARDAANGMDVRIGGGPNTIQQYLRTGLIDELHVAISPILLGGGERLFEGVDLRALGYECVQFVASEKATHVVLRRQGDARCRYTMGKMKAYANFDEYLKAQGPKNQAIIRALRRFVKRFEPKLSEAVKWGKRLLDRK